MSEPSWASNAAPLSFTDAAAAKVGRLIEQ
jgi:iron-sulfur cluster insertion protein